MINLLSILNILNALIDTAERTTELDNVYNDKNNTNVSWSEIYKLRDQLQDCVQRDPTLTKIKIN